MTHDTQTGLHSPIARFAVRTVVDAARVAAQRSSTEGMRVQYKNDGTPVTEVDRTIERKIRHAIDRAFPDDEVVGEEYHTTRKRSSYTWYVDPIDGTVAFVNRIPLFSTLLALYRGQEPIMGIIHNPICAETAIGIVGCGCYLNGKRQKIEPRHTIAGARLLFTDAVYLEREAPYLLSSLAKQCSSGRTWCDAYGFLLLVNNRADIVIDSGLMVWDIAPLYPIIVEAGGAVSDFSGHYSPLGSSIVACSPGAHTALLDIINRHEHT